MKTPIEFNNYLHAKYHKDFDEGKITKEELDEYLQYYKWVHELFLFKYKKGD
jgi:uncharacterized membrane protein